MVPFALGVVFLSSIDFLRPRRSVKVIRGRYTVGGDLLNALEAVDGFDFVDNGVGLSSGFLLTDLEGVKDS